MRICKFICVFALTYVNARTIMYLRKRKAHKKEVTTMDGFLLEAACKRKGFTNAHIAEVLGMDESTFYRKRKGATDFTRKEIQKLRSVLGLSSEDVDQIFFTD